MDRKFWSMIFKIDILKNESLVYNEIKSDNFSKEKKDWKKKFIEKMSLSNLFLFY